MISKIADIADRARLRADSLPQIASNPLNICVWVLIMVGVAARLSPFIDMDERLFWQYITEDGYLLQTVARNMAIGLGMSTAEGTIPTNGVQPLATFLFSALHFISGGSKRGGIALVTLFSVLVSAGAGYYAYKVASRIFASLRHGRELAIVSAALWFAAPHTVTHSMNGLETGIYFFAILFTLNYYLAAISGDSRPFSSRQRLVLGLLMGFTFLARNDAVFFIGGLLLAHLLLGDEKAGGGPRYRLVDCFIAGIISLVVASPWLINNYALFGSIVPISGISESRDAHFGQNLSGIPSQLFEATLLFAPMPGSIERAPLVILMSITSVALSLAGFWFFVAKLTLASRRFFLGSIFFAAGISLYYGLFFGAPYFLTRYVSPLSPLLWCATTATVFFLLNLFFHTFESVHRTAFSIVLILTFGAATFAYADFARGYAKGTSQMHRQVVEWVQGNVSELQWVGAPQTGTLGFFHDRTINLDGKVNPFALRAILEKGNVLEYARNSRIDYIVDWYAMADWVKIKGDPQFAKDFEVVVRDARSNLGVLRRIHPVMQK
ncbi:MAG: hypothetical protein A2W25_03635 [candidate division Zixibacteria bacterium RBG_16_53_22]|nr:MAG: hypothetical protein A2W25_03635 [candidate division Zixibacteria bacterium RBG_16_53_22]